MTWRLLTVLRNGLRFSRTIWLQACGNNRGKINEGTDSLTVAFFPSRDRKGAGAFNPEGDGAVLAPLTKRSYWANGFAVFIEDSAGAVPVTSNE
jgi:hypothetical protein